MGARLFSPHGESGTVGRSQDVGFIVHAGSDFPQEVREMFNSWQTGTPILETPERLTSRGKNVYQNEVRGNPCT